MVLVRTPAVYYDKLSAILRICLDLYNKYGVVSLDKLIDEANIGERMLREYLKDLVALNILIYVGGGQYLVNQDRVESLIRLLGGEPKIVDFIDPSLVRGMKTSREITVRITRIFEKLGIKDVLDIRIKERVRGEPQKPLPQSVLGDKLVLSGVCRKVILDDIRISGSASTYVVRDYSLNIHGEPFAFLTIAYVGASAFVGYYRNNMLVVDESVVRSIPRFEVYEGRSPFIEEEPFYELVTEYPELLGIGRKLAARLISELIHYKLDIEILEEFGDDIDLYIRYHSLLPHGYIISARRLMELQNKVYGAFEKFLEIARKKNVVVAGLSIKSHDNLFVKLLNNHYGLKLMNVNDDNVLLFLLNDGDTTAVVNRPVERGRVRIDNWYEFYMKIGDEILKLEYISYGKPIEEYAKIRDLVYSSYVVRPAQSVIYGPGPVVMAYDRAQFHANEIERLVRSILDGTFRSFMRAMRRGRR